MKLITDGAYSSLRDQGGLAFVIIDKVSGTPKKYPRKAGTPSKDPL